MYIDSQITILNNLVKFEENQSRQTSMHVARLGQLIFHLNKGDQGGGGESH